MLVTIKKKFFSAILHHRLHIKKKKKISNGYFLEFLHLPPPPLTFTPPPFSAATLVRLNWVPGVGFSARFFGVVFTFKKKQLQRLLFGIAAYSRPLDRRRRFCVVTFGVFSHPRRELSHPRRERHMLAAFRNLLFYDL